jgi:hypothetical protein
MEKICKYLSCVEFYQRLLRHQVIQFQFYNLLFGVVLDSFQVFFKSFNARRQWGLPRN